MLSFLLNCKRIYNDFIKDEVTVYAARIFGYSRESSFKYAKSLMLSAPKLRCLPGYCRDSLSSRSLWVNGTLSTLHLPF